MRDTAQQIFTVTQVNELVKALLDGAAPLQNVHIQGELSNYKIYPSGHHYFTLKDGSSAIRCVMFASSAMHLRFRPENGMKVVAAGRVSVYPRDGAYQLYCSSLSAAGVGDLYVAYEQLKEKLYQRGLFDEGHKKPLPRYPGRIAIVTSSAGAAVHDMIRILRRRYPIAKVILLPVRVQGPEAPGEIADAIAYANEHRLADVLITGRGGGSIEDLWAFNDERVAYAIYDSVIPVISAVGHEPDVTISDFVADARASTPSNAAEIAVPDMGELLGRLTQQDGRMRQGLLNAAEKRRQRLESVAARRIWQDSGTLLQDKRQALDGVTARLTDAGQRSLQQKAQRLATLSSAVDAMSPLKVLARGYAIATDEREQTIRTASQLTEGDRVHLRFHSGGAVCRVESRED